MSIKAVPIGRAMMQTIFISCGAALIVTTVAYFSYELVTFRRSSVQQLQTLGEAIASNCTAALAFDNPDDAAAVLGAFKADPSIRAAALYDSDHRIFATYPAKLPAASVPSAPGPLGYVFSRLRLTGFQPVTEGRRQLGTLYVESDLGAIVGRLKLYALIGVVVMTLSLLAAYLISRRLQGRILQPILALAETARAVSDRQDYSVRASPTRVLEFDELTESFNHMLTQIQTSEHRLQAQLGRLSLLQHITRAIGERQDIHSISQVVLGSLEASLQVDFACLLTRQPGADWISVSRLGGASRGYAVQLGLTEGVALTLDANGLAGCLTGVLFHEPATGESSSPFAQRFAVAQLQSLVLAPLTVEKEVSGVLLCARRAESGFSSGECEFLTQLSEHVALASHQASLNGALQQAYDDLQHSQMTLLQQERLRALGQMASGIAHDINNAISPVSLYTESLLEHEPNLSERARGYLATINQAIGDVARTVSRMREFYRDRESQMMLARVDINRAIRHVVELTKARWSDQAQQRGSMIDLQMQLADDLPNIIGADNEIRDALTNLIFNAVDSMPTGGILLLRTKTAADADGTDSVVIEIQDTGVGMDEDTRRRCLEPFFTTKGERGTGLGLAMVYGMVQRHSAQLEIESIVGVGTIVRLVFAAETASQVDAAGPVSPLIPTRSLRILLVDDDPVLLQSLRDILTEDGHVVTPSNGGQAGIDAFAAAVNLGEAFDLVVTDQGMPHVDGRRVAAAVKALSSATPVILLTGWGQRIAAEDGAPANIDRVLSKPPRLQQLRAAFAELSC